jgi:hypothetical protein
VQPPRAAPLSAAAGIDAQQLHDAGVGAAAQNLRLPPQPLLLRALPLEASAGRVRCGGVGRLVEHLDGHGPLLKQAAAVHLRVQAER